MNIWDVNIDNTVISKLVRTKTNSKYLIRYLDKDIRPLKLFGLRLKIQKTIELNALPVHRKRYVKTKIRTYTNFCCLNVPKDDVECESFTVIFVDFLLV